MSIIRSDLPKLLKDNEEIYIQNIKCCIDHADPNSSIEIRNIEGGLIFHIKPSTDLFKQCIIENLLSVHKAKNLKIIFSKSLAISSTISFTVNFSN